MTGRAGVEPRADSAQLRAFVPTLALELDAQSGVRAEKVDGSMLSADISGFTALSERLADKGKAGAEEITSLINTCFQTLIDTASMHGGDVIKFGGDAILVIFRGHDHAVRAGLAAITMQHDLANLSRARRAGLTMTVGVADGPFDAFLVGEHRRELLLCGERASEVIRLEAACEKGATLLSPAIATAVSNRLTEEAGGGLMAVHHLPEAVAIDEANLAAHIPGSVFEQLSAIQEMDGEHRLVCVGFIMVGGIDERISEHGIDQVGDELAGLIEGVRQACIDHQVTFLSSDIAPSGAKLILAAGAPLTSGQDEDGLLQTALAVTAIDTPFDVRVGAQRGRVFAGFLGADQRRAYTVMGDPVNTAARLLGPAQPGQVIASAALLDSTYTIYDAEDLPPFMVKGKSEPLHARRVLAVTTRRRRSLADLAEFVGRKTESKSVQQALGKPGGVVEIVGPPGAGKSRLLAENVGAFDDDDIYLAAAAPYGSNSPYSLFRSLLRRCIGLAPMSPPEEVGIRLTEVVEEHSPTVAPFLPLLAIPFGAAVAMTDAVEAIEPAFRRTQLHHTFVEFLDAVIGDKGALLIAEDVHWMDEASAELLTFLIEALAARPWRCAITAEAGADWSTGDATNCTHLVLDPLSDTASLRLAKDTSPEPLPDSTLQSIVERAGGNPLFCIELARSAGSGSDLPDSVEAAVSRRIDELSPALRRALRIAAVVGQDFNPADVEVISGSTEVRQFRELEFIERGAASDALRFRNTTFREVAYEGLPYNERKRIHARTAEHLVATGRGAELTLLALHYSEGGVHAKAWDFGRRAGELATAQLAHEDAAAAFERALRSARYVQVSRHDRRDVAAALGHSLSVIGRFDDARKAYDQARKYNDDEVLELDYLREIGTLHERSGRTSAALTAFSRAAKRIPAATKDDRLIGARARLELARSGIIHRRGEQAECREIAHRSLTDARRAGDRSTEALALDRIHLATTYLGEQDHSGSGQQALEIFRELGDKSNEARVLINLGIAAYFAEDWSTARDCYGDAADAANACGNLVYGGNASLNRAEILSDQGHWDEALELLDGVTRNWQAAGYATGIAAATLFTGIALMRRGDHEAALEAINTAADELDRIGVQELVDEARSRALQTSAAAGTATVKETKKALKKSQGAQRALRSHAMTLRSAGHADEALATLADGVEGATGYELALTSQLLSQLAPDDERAPGWATQAREELQRLGVVRTMFGETSKL